MTEKLYSELADWWTLLSPVAEYAEEAALFEKVIRENATATPSTLLELGAGGGHNAFYLKARFDMTLVDLSEDMMRQSRQTNPELRHLHGDMRNLRLGEEFDAVFIHDAIGHMASREDLERAMATAFAHCRPGGLALFAPDETKERFATSTTTGGTDDGSRGFRFLEWNWDPDPDDDTAISDYAFMIRDERGEVRVVHDRHIHGLFPRQVWLDSMAEVGFEAHSELHDHSDLEEAYELFVGHKPPK